MAIPAAFAGVHGTQKGEVTGVGLRRGGADHGDDPLLHGLAEDLNHIFMKLWQLIQKENPMVGQGDFARPGIGIPSAGHAAGGDGVMRGAEGALGEQRMLLGGQPHHRVNLGGLQGLPLAERGQNGGEAPGQHALARARGPHHEKVVSPGGGNFQGSLHRLLSPDLREVRKWKGIRCPGPGRGGGDGGLAGEVGGQLVHRLHRVDGEPIGR